MGYLRPLEETHANLRLSERGLSSIEIPRQFTARLELVVTMLLSYIE